MTWMTMYLFHVVDERFSFICVYARQDFRQVLILIQKILLNLSWRDWKCAVELRTLVDNLEAGCQFCKEALSIFEST